MENLKITLTTTKDDLELGVGFLFEESVNKDAFLEQAHNLVEAMARKLHKDKVLLP